MNGEYSGNAGVGDAILQDIQRWSGEKQKVINAAAKNIRNQMFIVVALSFAEEVESLLYFFFVSSLVDAYVADIAQECEVDDARRILLVVVHQFDECRVVVACDVDSAVVFAYEPYGLVHAVCGESRLACTHVQFAWIEQL